MHGFIPPERFFPYLTWKDVEALENKENVVIIQPIGAIEQHGPHLPLAVDAAISLGVLGKALEKLSPRIPAYALPCLYYGKSNEHIHFPGTITLSAATLAAVVTEMAESVYRSGFRKLILMNSHGGQPQVLEIVARDLHEKYRDFLVFSLFTWRVPHNAGDLISGYELENGIHAGDAETSIMLALLKERVKIDRFIKEYPPEFPPDSLLSIEGKLPVPWLTGELSSSGVIGDATTATEEKGIALLESVSDGWVKVITEIHGYRGLSLKFKDEK